MNRFFGRFSVGKRIATGYAVLLVISLSSCIYSILVFRQSSALDEQVTKLYQPSLASLQKLKEQVSRSYRLIRAWVYHPTDDQTAELRNIHSLGIVETQKDLRNLSKDWDDQSRAVVSYIIDETLTLIQAEKKIMQQLDSPESYFDATKVEAAVDNLEKSIGPVSKSLQVQIDSLIQHHQSTSNKLTESKYRSVSTVQRFITLSLILSVIVGAAFAVFSTRAIVMPINKLRTAILALSKGELAEIQIQKPDDEIGDMIESTNLLVYGLKKTAEFSEKIASGNFDEEYAALSNINELDQALYKMRTNLITIAKEEDKRNWVIEGLAKFSETLRNQTDLQYLADQVISNLVKYVNAHRGGIFIINSTSQDIRFMELVSCYAWYGKDESTKKIYYGEGLLGQCWKDGASIYLTNELRSIHPISTGLEQYEAASLIIVPLKVNEDVFGVIELSSFQPFEPHEIEFIERVCVNVAAAMMGAVNTTQTKKLLKQFQDQTEHLRAKEEEMRQMLEQSLQQTEQLQSQEETLRKNQANLQETIKINSKLLSVISHDIRGPFASIKGMIQLYNKGMVTDDELKHHLGNVESLITNTDMLFTNMLQWSVFYMDNRALNKKPIELARVVSNNIELFSAAAQNKSTLLFNNITPGVVVDADEPILNLVLRNFISNAIKFTDKGTVSVSCREIGDTIEVLVEDTGMGMTPHQLSNLFNWDLKQSNNGTRNEKGAGVGLLICKEFIEIHSGQLSCSSRKDAGTVFSFTLPRHNETRSRNSSVNGHENGLLSA
jgi:signal transduction histidine kinase/methyl-accepting chemotaxis protein